VTNMIEWRIYYGDGTTFDNTKGLPSEAPSLNVQVILCKNKINGRNIYHTWDWYYFKENEWRGCDIHGLIDQLLMDKKGVVTAIKQGRTIKDEVYEDILKKALNDTDFSRRIVNNKLDKPIGSSGGVMLND